MAGRKVPGFIYFVKAPAEGVYPLGEGVVHGNDEIQKRDEYTVMPILYGIADIDVWEREDDYQYHNKKYVRAVTVILFKAVDEKAGEVAKFAFIDAWNSEIYEAVADILKKHGYIVMQYDTWNADIYVDAFDVVEQYCLEHGHYNFRMEAVEESEAFAIAKEIVDTLNSSGITIDADI